MTGMTPLYSTTARVQQFSDGVFSIAITLLILELKIPSAMDAPDLIKQLVGQWPSYLAYVLSFVLIGIMWSNHHNILRYIDRSNHNFMMLNVLLMLFVAGLIEGGLRQLVDMTAARFAIGSLTGALWLWYFMSGRGKKSDGLPS